MLQVRLLSSYYPHIMQNISSKGKNYYEIIYNAPISAVSYKTGK